MTRDEALALAFPRCEIERQTKYLTDPQRAAVAELAGVPFAASVVYPYRATRDGKLVGVAYLETHRVRSLRETLMVVVTPDDKIRRVEVLAFAEPKDYLPRSIWYDQFKGRGLDKDLELHRKIRNVTGATLSGRAATLCARRVLALHKTLARIEAEEAERKEAERDAKKKEAGKGKDEKGSGGGGAGSGPVH